MNQDEALQSMDQAFQSGTATRIALVGLCYMFHRIAFGLQNWLDQLMSLTVSKLNHMTPQDYCIVTVLAISVGYCLLKGKN